MAGDFVQEEDWTEDDAEPVEEEEDWTDDTIEPLDPITTVPASRDS